jgi:hypothetical protein
VFLRELDDLAGRGITDWEGLVALVRLVRPQRPRRSPKLRYEPTEEV